MTFQVEDLNIEREGVALHTRITRPEMNGTTGRKYPAVIMMHGFLGNLGYEPDSLFAELSDKLVAEGFITVRFDFDGRGESGGERNGFDAYREIEDAMAVLEYVRNLDEVDEISLLGHSFGGVIAGMTAGLYADVIHTLVLMAPAATAKTDAQAGHVQNAQFDPEHVSERLVIPGRDATISGRFPRVVRMLPIYETTSAFEGQTLCVQGRDDAVVSPHASEEYAKVMPHCEASFYNDLGHTFIGKDRGEALEEIAQFLIAHYTVE
ncbi:alpha/beta hydrolase family protein [Bifidobacterium magnum]|uniref:Alpha/beta hydrolase n=1 Tax=Bifidobacterium magnum TaxID=1692 RepID=A0A087BCS1_9BIFI|nr:alpha/beta fold hydrolase [Bifidobacterium magnum]KFI68821.1 Alpha/beta hydrolase [Bifidobacterium magnum]